MVALHGGACDSALVQLNMGCVVYLQRIGRLLSKFGHAIGCPYPKRENVGLYQNTASDRDGGGEDQVTTTSELHAQAERTKKRKRAGGSHWRLRKRLGPRGRD